MFDALAGRLLGRVGIQGRGVVLLFYTSSGADAVCKSVRHGSAQYPAPAEECRCPICASRVRKPLKGPESVLWPTS